MGHKKILLTGATDGIGLETANMLVEQGHTVLIHGRNASKIEKVYKDLLKISDKVQAFQADLSKFSDVKKLVEDVKSKHEALDVIINNAGVFKVSDARTESGLDCRFVVNTIAPYFLAQQLLTLLPLSGRVINLSSAAQSTVDEEALAGRVTLDDNQAYSQSKLAITMWSAHLAKKHPEGPIFVSVNPASFLGSKMVKEAYGVAGHDLKVGADILVKAALSAEFQDASGRYYDNDLKKFGNPHVDARDPVKNQKIVEKIEGLIQSMQSS